MNTYQDGSFVIIGSELEYITGGVQQTPNGEIFSSGLEIVAEGKDMMRNGGAIGASFGLAQTIIGGWYLVVGGVADWIGSWF